MVRAAMLASAGAVFFTPACRQAPETPAPAPSSVSTPTSAASSQDPTRLPEDPIAGKASEAQWRQHMEEEEHERQVAFDSQRLEAHRTVKRLIAAGRARYDRAQTDSAVGKARSDVGRQVAEIRRRVTELDPWGVNSPLLGEYEKLEALLSGGYADARIAALKGDGRPLADVQERFDRGMQVITDWLEEVEREEEKDEHE